MDLLELIVKILIVVLSVLAMAVPFLISAIRIYLDKRDKTRHKHLRVFIFSLIYCGLMTLALALVGRFYTKQAYHGKTFQGSYREALRAVK